MTHVFDRPRRRGRLALFCAVLGLLLLCRDVLSVPVSRMLFLLVVCAALVCLNVEETRLFVFFLMPLYAGLPGNYITVLLIGKLLFLALSDTARFRISAPCAVCSVLFAAYVFIQNFSLGYVSTYHFAFCAEILLLMLLISDGSPVPLRRMAELYSASVLISGICALFVCAGENSFSDILTGAVRFGDVYGTGGMRMTLDPNFLGFSCLSGIAVQAELLRRIFAAGKAKEMRRDVFVSLFFIVSLGFFGLIGLSRTFFLCAAVLLLFELIACARTPRMLVRCLLFLSLFAVFAFAAVSVFLPELIKTAVSRFQSADLAGANGRVTLIKEWGNAFMSSAGTLLFGVGLFRTNVHFTALQYVFGLGIAGCIPAFSLFGFFVRGIGLTLRKKGKIPASIAALMSCAVPAACSLSALFPLVFALYASAGLARFPDDG